MRTLAGRFDVGEIAGRGAMGVVHRGRDRESGAPVAIKLLEPQSGASRFSREVEALAAVGHPAVVRYVAHGLDGETPFLVTDWIDGRTLATYLAARGALSHDDARTIVTRLADGLAAAHRRGIVHRDLKPANVMVPDDGGLAGAVLVDFGLARAVERSRVTRTGAIVGTCGYLSPEQARGVADIDARSDVFALGCVAFECLTGRPAFEGEQMVAVLARLLLDPSPRVADARPDVPEALARVVDRMLARDRDARPREGAAVLALLAQGDVAPASDVAVSERERRFSCAVLVGGHAPDRVLATLRARSSSIGLERLHDGTLLVLTSHDGTPRDHVHGAVAHALSVRAEAHAVPIAIASDHAVEHGGRTVGPLFDRAAALLAATPDGEIRIDEPTARLAESRFAIGRDGPILRVTGRRESVALTRRATFVGRGRELGLLSQAFRACVEEKRAEIVVVGGEAGLGKTRLAHELVIALQREASEACVVEVAAEPLGEGDPFGLAARILRAVRDAGLSVLGDDALELARLTTRPSAPQRSEDARGPQGGPGGCEIPPARNHSEDGSPAILRARYERAFVEVLGRCTESRALVVIADDVHWADAPSLDLLEAALEALADSPFFLVVLTRPPPAPSTQPLFARRAPTHIALRRLGERDALELVRQLAGATLDDDRLRELVARAEGNAYLLEELARAQAFGDATAPASVLGIVEARIAALPSLERRVLRAAAVFGHRFPEEGVTLLVGRPTAAAALDTLVTHALIEREAPGHLVFRHALTRDAAYAMLPETDRRAAHARVASYLSAVPGTSPAVLAHHHDEAGEPAEAAAAYASAAEMALGAGDSAAAARFVARGLALATPGEARARLLLAKSNPTAALADEDSRGAMIREARAWVPAQSALWLRALGMLMARAPPSAIELSDALASVDPEPDAPHLPERIVVLGGLVHRTVALGDRATHEAALARLQHLAPAESSVAVENALSVPALRDGQLLPRCLERLGAFAHDPGHSNSDRKRAAQNLTYVAAMTGDVELAQEALALDEAIPGGPFWEAQSRLHEAFVLRARGESERALELAERLVVRFGASEPRERARAALIAAERRIEKGDADRAIDLLAGSLAYAERTNVAMHRSALALEARARLLQGDRARALEIARGAATTGDWLSFDMRPWYLRAVLGLALAATGDREQARVEIDRAVRSVERHRDFLDERLRDRAGRVFDVDLVLRAAREME